MNRRHAEASLRSAARTNAVGSTWVVVARMGLGRGDATATYIPCYVVPNITPIMLSSDLCDVQHRSADRQRVPTGRTSHKLVRVEPGSSAGQDCRANVFVVAAVWLRTCPAPSPSSPDRFPHRYSSCRWRRAPAMRGSC